MKATLKLSVLLNCVLAGCLIHELSHRPKARHDFGLVTALTVAADASVLVPPSESKPFHWSQVEAADYRVYLANLRSIGCPELTIRDIILADVDSMYSANRAQLHLSEAGDGPWSRKEESLFVSSLLGELPAKGIESPIPQNLEMPPEPGSRAVTTPLLPLVFQTVDLEALRLNPGQKKAIEQLRQQFLARIGGRDQNPSDPAYYERWQEAQPEMDDMLRGMIGVSAFEDYQLGNAARPADE